MTKGLHELLWLKELLTEIDFPPVFVMNLLCNNKVVIIIVKNPFPFVKFGDQLVVTKAIIDSNFHNSLNKLDIKNVYEPT
ncbi:hypothetical protein CR513_19991, partial [Mucuna pruriens]